MFAKTLHRGKKGGLRITYDAGRIARREQGQAAGSYTLDAGLLMELDARFVEDGDGLWSFVSGAVPRAIYAKRHELGKMNPARP